MSLSRLFLSVLLCVPSLIHAVNGASLPPPPTGNDLSPPKLWFSPNPVGNNNDWQVGLIQTNRSSLIAGQAMVGIITQAMYSASQYPQDDTARYFTHTLNFTTEAYKSWPVPFVVTIGIRATQDGSAKGQYPMTYERVLEVTTILGYILTYQADLNQMHEWDFDVFATDPRSAPQAILKVIARGSVAAPPRPLNDSELPAATA
ncbi:MAG: hypothetical protein Q9222_000965 [Ikaeria aurantiellina]